jgi:hypothetical protein
MLIQVVLGATAEHEQDTGRVFGLDVTAVTLGCAD